MRTHILLIFVVLFSQSGFCQTLEEIEDDLYDSYQKIYAANSEDYEMLEQYNDSFKSKILRYTSNYPATLTYSFPKLSKEISITSSDDSMFRIYSWNTHTGGTMHWYNNLHQYNNGKDVYAENSPFDEYNPQPYYHDIYTLYADGNTYYLAISTGRYSTKDMIETVEVLGIEKHMFNESVKMIKTKDGLVNNISFPYDFFSVVDRPERPLKLIKYDSKTRSLLIPVVYEDGKVTDRYLTYRFNGKYFEYAGVQK